MVPEPSNAASRVTRPSATSTPTTSSIRPAHQYGHVPKGTAPDFVAGHPNNLAVPCSANSPPTTIRKTPSTGAEKRFRSESMDFTTRPYAVGRR